ncbi:MAG: hypothetical protein ABIP35_15170 [Ginsengibacter sp.]
MKKLFFMHKVKDKSSFLKSVVAMSKQKNAKIFHCYVCGDIFKIATAKKVQEFDFSSFKNDKEVVAYIQSAIDILRQNLPEQVLLF